MWSVQWEDRLEYRLQAAEHRVNTVGAMHASPVPTNETSLTAESTLLGGYVRERLWRIANHWSPFVQRSAVSRLYRRRRLLQVRAAETDAMERFGRRRDAVECAINALRVGPGSGVAVADATSRADSGSSFASWRMSSMTISYSSSDHDQPPAEGPCTSGIDQLSVIGPQDRAS
jgi:hypothetical protein